MDNSLLQPKHRFNGPLLAFLWGMAGALAIFLPFLIVDKGFFLYCGDYNEQQIPFYMYANHFIKQGGGTWSWATDMGSSFVNSYSFYNLGSPFLWLSLFVPSRLMPFAMVPLFMLKFGSLAAAACLFLQRYAKTRNMAVICALVYAFCGFNVYNIFFNHMLEPAILFPLMLWSMDAFVHNGLRGAFALSLGLGLVNSYFFFAGNVVFLLLYFFVKLACGDYKITLPKFGLLAFEAVLGVGLGMVLALPSLLMLIGNPRTNNFADGMSLLLYGNSQQYFAILTSMFLPPDPPYLPNLFPDASIKWTSMSLFLPLVGMGGVIAYTRARRKTSTKILLFISLVAALVPVLNSSFYALNASYYARWYYMPLLLAALATLHSLEDEDIDLAAGARISLIITAVMLVFALVPDKVEDSWKLGLASEDARKLWLTLLTALLAAVVFALIVHLCRKKRRFAPILLAAVMGFSAFYAVIHIALGKMPQWERDANYYQNQWQGSAQVNLPGGQFYRIDSYEAHDNIGLWLNKSHIRTFNSVVNPSIMEFYPYVGVKRDVSSKPETKFYALRGLLGVRYTLVPHNQADAFLTQPGVQGWTQWATQGPYTIFENQNFVPMGFTYNQFVAMSYLDTVSVDDRSPLLMRAIGLDEEQTGQYRHLFPGGEAVWWATSMDTGATGVQSETGWYQYDPVSFERYTQDAAARRATSAYNFTADNGGFVCDILLDRENLVFFGVPYDDGFSATVNGEEAEVLKVSGGMMAVYAPEGDNHIVFSYHTPGLRAGAVISLVSLAALATYVAFVRFVRNKRTTQGAGVLEE